MSKIKKIRYKGREHGSFEEEWGLHKGCSEWWYATGYLKDDLDRLYSYQFTVLRVHVSAFFPYLIMLGLTDFSTGKHAYYQNIQLSSKGIVISPDTIGYGDIAQIRKGEQGMTLAVQHKDFTLDLELNYGKGAVWHCDNGFLRMGIHDEKQTTVYYSYPNMPTAGTMRFNGNTVHVTGKSWFDKQGGPYSLMNIKTHWEWFSLRFFDDEEMMLFSFPQSHYQDGTYIRKNGDCHRLNNYTITPTEFAYPNGVKYSCKWELTVPGFKAERYTIIPLLKGQMNMGYYELLASIYNDKNEQVGLCFVELLPGVYNKKFKRTLLAKTKDNPSNA
ncbi:MAG TPA: lipocalin-like domain-containing protein [Brevefilum sp.]|nr:lipocalin-like domain-containing protein [Brevefilum sp.]HOR18793.1 lipocalin-like domain-containing protein [Brevefilum sp.]HPL68694.1 lipocalin-like domain-containing protein [Brevefilum sp.]